MAKQAEPISATFQLRGVELQELVIHKVAPGSSIATFNFDISVETNVDVNQKIVIASTRIKILAEDKITELGYVSCACVFSVANFDEIINVRSDNVIDLIEPFAETINSISISTTRGYMASELKGTVLHYAFLPIIDIKSLTKKNF